MTTLKGEIFKTAALDGVVFEEVALSGAVFTGVTLDGQIESATATVLTFLLRDDFTTAEAAPLASPRTCEPGPGSWTIEQGDSKFNIAAGRLVVLGNSNDYDWVTSVTTFNRKAGMTMALLDVVMANVTNDVYWPWYNRMRTNWTKDESGSRLYNDDNQAVLNNVPLTYTNTGVICVLRNLGAFYYMQTASGDWVLGGIDSESDEGVAGSTIQTGSYYATVDWSTGSIRVSDLSPAAGNAHTLPAVGLDLCTPGSGTGKSSIAAPANGNTFVIDVAGVKLQWTADNPLQAHTVRWRDDGADYYELDVAADGSFALDDPAASAIISGGAGSIAADDVVTINHTAAGAVEAFAGETSLGTASGETTNPTATAGSVVTAGGITLFTARTLATKDGLCTSILPGPIADSDTFTHAADGFIQLESTELPSTGSATIDHALRQQDGTHRWIVRVDDSGNLKLIEDNAGETTRISGAGVVAASEVNRLYFNDNVYRLYNATTYTGTYTDSNNLFKTETSGNVAISAEGYSSDLIAFDQPGGEALAALEEVEAAT